MQDIYSISPKRVENLSVETQKTELKQQGLPFVQRMTQAQSFHALADYRGATLSACLAFECLIEKRLDLAVLMLLAQIPCPDKNVEILRTEIGLRIQIDHQHFTAQDSGKYLHFVQQFSQRLQAPPAAERLFVLLQRLSVNYLSSGHSLSWKRKNLTALHKLRYFLLTQIPVGCAFTEDLKQRLSRIFHEPERHVNNLLRRHYFYFEFNYAKRLLHRRTSSLQQRHLNQFFWPEAESYAAFMAGHPGSIVLATIHMGDFVGALHRISQVTGSTRRTISLQRDPQPAIDNDYATVRSSSHQVMRHGHYKSIDIVSSLRSGGCILSAFFDLGNDFGTTITVKFFDYPCAFVKGPAHLAIMGRAPIIPFVTYEHDGRDIIEMDELIDTVVPAGECLTEASRRITQKLINLAEKWIKANPEQWKYLPALFSYFEKTRT
jgi:predicted LPLAT superfamily acyltransferase